MPVFPAAAEKKCCETKDAVGRGGKAWSRNRRVTDAFTRISRIDRPAGVPAIRHRTAKVIDIDPEPAMPEIAISAENSGARFAIVVLNSVSLDVYRMNIKRPTKQSS